MRKVVVTGAAGLVGQNLIVQLKQRDDFEIIAIDKHPANTALLRSLHPDLTVIEADLARSGDWEGAFDGATDLVMSHAQIGGLQTAEFVANNVTATRNILACAERAGVGYIVHLSSSVVNSAAEDDYTRTKEEQETIVAGCAIPHVILRPTLMFGWFDRKHLGWLSRFMQKVPVFPIPGSGRYLRQPLYVGDFCAIIRSCLETRHQGSYNISGQERIDYIDMIHELKRATGAKARIVRIPYRLFWLLLSTYALVDRDPPFTVKQLEALVTPDVFEVIDWPDIFGVQATSLRNAFDETYQHPDYSSVVLDF